MEEGSNFRSTVHRAFPPLHTARILTEQIDAPAQSDRTAACTEFDCPRYTRLSFSISSPPDIAYRRESRFVLSLRRLGVPWEYARVETGICPRGIRVVTYASGGVRSETTSNTRHGFLVIGTFRRHERTLMPRERLIVFQREYLSEQELFSAMKKEYIKLRGWRRWFSLKEARRFGLYRVGLLPNNSCALR